MSERGTFVTSYIYCKDCLTVLVNHLGKKHKYFCGRQLQSWKENKLLPIIAGKVGGLYPREEIHMFQDEIVPVLENSLCHPMRIAILAENGQEIIEVNPR